MSPSTPVNEVLTIEEARAIAEWLDAHADPDHAARYRFLLATGIRAGATTGREADSIAIEDITREPGWVIIPHQKGGGVRISAFCDGFEHSPTLRHVLDYLDYDERATGPLWRLGYNAFYKSLDRAARAAGAQRLLGTSGRGRTWRVHPHGLRHTWVARCRDAGIDWADICSLGWKAGPAAMPTVARHYAHLDLAATALRIRSHPIAAPT